MIGYNDPVIELLPNPQGIDFEIQNIQQKLASLSWLQKCFGRCTKQEERVDKREDISGNGKKLTFYPEVYNQREPMTLMVNDNLASYCFFHCFDPLTFKDFSGVNNEELVTQTVGIYFWANLEKIDRNKDYNFVEELRGDVIKKLKFTRFSITESFLEYDQVFRPFTITETFKTFIKPPYTAFRINGELTFDYFKC